MSFYGVTPLRAAGSPAEYVQCRASENIHRENAERVLDRGSENLMLDRPEFLAGEDDIADLAYALHVDHRVKQSGASVCGRIGDGAVPAALPVLLV